MKILHSKTSSILWLTMGLLSVLVLFTQCKEEDDEGGPVVEAPIASFDVGTIDGLTVNFVNASVNATTYNWDFGDGNTSTDANPEHTYAEGGDYTVKLTATNAVGSADASKTVSVIKAGIVEEFIINKSWQPIRGEALALALGPQEDNWSWNTGLAPWFSWGDLEGATFLGNRMAATNDIYTFNEDGTYDVDFNGDFWAEFGIWGGTAFNETDLDISGGTLPPNANGDDVSAFIAGKWDYAIDEVELTLSVIGAGAHILNPRYKNGESSYDAGEGVNYNIVHMAEGPEADTLVLSIDTHDNDFNSDPRSFFVFAYYKGNVPDLKPVSGWTPTDYADEVSASTISHVFDTEGNFGMGVDSVETSYTVTYGVEIGGETGTQLDRIADNGNEFQDFKLVSTDADIRFDDCGTFDYAVASIDVYVPSSNDFSVFTNQVEIILADESGLDNGAEGGPGFWTDWELLTTKTDIPLDQWVNLTFDFSVPDGDTGMDLNAVDAQCGIRDNIDLVIIRVGGSAHGAGGTYYVKDFKFIEQ